MTRLTLPETALGQRRLAQVLKGLKMWTMKNLIAKYLKKTRDQQSPAGDTLNDQLASGVAIVLNIDISSWKLMLKGNCSRQEAITEIETHLSGRRPGAGKGPHPLRDGRHGIV